MSNRTIIDMGKNQTYDTINPIENVSASAVPMNVIDEMIRDLDENTFKREYINTPPIEPDRTKFTQYVLVNDVIYNGVTAIFFLSYDHTNEVVVKLKVSDRIEEKITNIAGFLANFLKAKFVNFFMQNRNDIYNFSDTHSLDKEDHFLLFCYRWPKELGRKFWHELKDMGYIIVEKP